MDNYFIQNIILEGIQRMVVLQQEQVSIHTRLNTVISRLDDISAKLSSVCDEVVCIHRTVGEINERVEQQMIEIDEARASPVQNDDAGEAGA